MPVPTYDQFVFPLLRYLGEHPEGVRSRDAYEALAEQHGLTDADRAQLLPTRSQRLYQNRIGWAHDRLKRARLSESASRGLWRITDTGKTFLDEHPSGLRDSELEALTKVSADSKASGSDSDLEPQLSKIEGSQTQSPEERIEAAIEELRDSLATELLDLIGKSAPEFFESLVLDVLNAMGYGASRAALKRTGKSGDGGIDGIISLDRLGLEKVYVQAKRWANTVGRPEIQAFYGALAGRRATKGVFITTSDFSKEAREFAGQVSDSIVLVNGSLLTTLMIDYGVGVSIERSLKIARLDSDYFEL